jgi:hypothetical protein
VRYVAEVAMRRADGRTEPESCLAQRAAVWVEKDMAEVRMREAREKGKLEEKWWGLGSRLVDIKTERKHSRKIWERHVIFGASGVFCLSIRQTLP